MQRLVGNEQLVAIKDKAADLETRIKDWSAVRELAEARTPGGLCRAAGQARGGIDAPKAHLDQVAAIREQRLLLEPSDPAAAVRVALAGLLREAVQTLHAAHGHAFEAALGTLARTTRGASRSADRDAILAAVGLIAPAKPNLATDEQLLATLDARPLSTTQAEIDAVPGRVARAIEHAAKLLEPKVQAIALERATLHDAAPSRRPASKAPTAASPPPTT